MNSRRLTELRSLAAHRLLAERLLVDEAMLHRVAQRLSRWSSQHAIHPEYALRWEAWLSQPRPRIAALISQDNEEGRDMRLNSPFAGELPAKERWQLWRDVKHELANPSAAHKVSRELGSK